MKSLQPAQLRLLRNLLFVALIMAGLIVMLTTYMSNIRRNEYSATVISHATEKVATDIENSLQPFNKSLQILKKWGIMRDLSSTSQSIPLKPERLTALLIPIMEQSLLSNSFHLIASTGTDYLLIRQNNQWLTRTVNLSQWGPRQKWQRWQLSGELKEQWWGEEGDDPRTERWYQNILSKGADQPLWSEPHLFEFNQQPVLTGAIQWQHPNDNQINYVAAFDIQLQDLYSIISKIKTTDNGLTFILTNNGHVFLPQDGQNISSSTDIDKQIFLPPSKLENPVIAEAATVWHNQHFLSSKPFSLRVNKQRWWAGFKPLGDRSQPLFWAGIVIPEADFLGDVKKQTTLTIILLVLVIFGGGWGIVQMVRRHSHRLKKIHSIIEDATQLEALLPTMIEQGEGGRMEFKSTMRQNLKENKPGKGIELAWLKAVVAYLNSQGGILLIGVADDGQILGLDADNFANEDKCHLHFKNLINHHIGLEYSRYIHMDLVSCAGKQIIVVQCEKSQTPIFLKNKNDEEFYIRSGPSCTKLTGSKLLNYLKHSKLTE